MKKVATIGLLLAGITWACTSTHDVKVKEHGRAAAEGEDDDGDESEELVPLVQIPQIVKDAAVAAVPGLVIKEAERESDRAGLHYCVHGAVDGVFTEVEVSPDGKVLGIESGDDEDDDEGGDDD